MVRQDREEEEASSSEARSSSDSEEELDVQEELQDPEFLQLLARARGLDAQSAAANVEAALEAQIPKAEKKRKRDKPIRLKDLSRAGEELDEMNEETNAAEPLPYAQDLEASRREFLQAVEPEDDEDEELFETRPLAVTATGTECPEGSATQQLLDRYFGKDEDLTEDDLFLKKFISQQGTDEEAAGSGEAKWQPQDDLEDEEYLEKADKFEAAYNFRFEEPGSGAVKTYPRTVTGVVREGDSRRAEARERKKQRKTEEKAKQQAEVQRLKNVTRRDIEERLQEIQKQSGAPAMDSALEKLLASNDFDADEYDKAMSQVFGTAYYEADIKDAPAGHDEGASSGESDDEFDSQSKKIAAEQKVIPAKQQRPAAGGDPPPVPDTAAVQRLLEQYHKLDYEDMVAGVPTRFPYKQVEKLDYGLSTADILSLSDKDLNQIIGLKRLAPYRIERNARKGRYQAMHKLDQLKKGKLQTDSDAKTASGEVEREDAVQTEEERARAHRLATYAKPQLKKRNSAQRKTSQEDEITVGPIMSKAQKRNVRRSRVRKGSLGEHAKAS